MTGASPDYRFFGAFRLMLAWLVMTSHSGNYLPGWVVPLALGNVGVFAFFVLSGFVIAEACDRFYPGAAKRFLANRLLRIYPTYWVACAIALAVYVPLHHPQLELDARSAMGNLLILYAEPGTFFWLSLIWAVGIELRFYFVAALLNAALSAFRSRARLVFVLFGAGALTLYCVTVASDFSRLATFRFAPFFVLGVAAYYAIAQSSRAAALAAGAALPFALHSYFVYNSPGEAPALTTALFSGALALMVAAAFARVSLRAMRLDKVLGDLTYPLYLVHWPMIYLVDRLLPAKGLPGYGAIAALSMTAAAGVLLIEQPIARLRDKVRRRRLYA